MSRQTEYFYNKFSRLYPLVDLVLKSQKAMLFNEINNLPNGNLLEIGVGNGAHLHLYKKHQITGIDTSAAMLKIADKKGNENIRLVKMNGEKLLFADEEFDYVVLCHVIAVVDHPEQLMREALRVLKPKGEVFILNHFTPDNWLRWIDHLFEKLSKLLRFRSVFYTHQIPLATKLALHKEVRFGTASYFKLLIYQKK